MIYMARLVPRGRISAVIAPVGSSAREGRVAQQVLGSRCDLGPHDIQPQFAITLFANPQVQGIRRQFVDKWNGQHRIGQIHGFQINVRTA